MTTPAKTATSAAPPSPSAFVQSALQIIAKGLSDEHVTVEAIQAELKTLVDAYNTQPPTLVMKAVASRRMIYGWGSVVTKGGAVVSDRQGDEMDMDNLREKVHEFMDVRKGDALHTRDEVGEVVDSFVMDSEVAAAFGVDFGREGWMVGYRINKGAAGDRVLKRVESGELSAFSIDVDAWRTPINPTGSK